MKNKFKVILIFISVLFLVGCGNKQVFDTKWTFNKAKISFGNEVIEIDVKSWKDYDDTSIQIIDKNGSVYYTDLKNVLLIND